MKRKKPTKSDKVRSRKKKLFLRQNGKCHYCFKRMFWSTKQESQTNPLLATLEHLDHRLSGLRGKIKGERTVLACRHCNHSKGKADELFFKTNKLEIENEVGY